MIATDTLQQNLDIIGFQKDNSETPAIVFVSELENEDNNLNPFQLLELEKAASFKADAVFFRYFEDNRTPIPQVYIYDNSSNNITLDDYAEIHKELWSSCNIPTFIIVEKTKLKFFDCRKPVSISNDGNIITKEVALIDINNLSEYSEVIELYNAEKFRNGSFWESEEGHKNYLYTKTAYNNLINKLKTLRKDYNQDYGLSRELFDYVIIISTLIKFLEENGIDSNGENLASSFFQQTVNCTSFLEVLQQGKLTLLLHHLATKFNGGIFNLEEKDKEQLNQANLEQIIHFFDAKIDSHKQYVFWDLYSFKHIPVELISNIYEEFLPKEDKGAVYTPHYLVNFIIDECLPVGSVNPNNFIKKTIDVSCGSGIFLVNVYKRLVDLYKISEYNRTKSFPKSINIEILQKILKDNIFGIDINTNAVELTKFSLQLALCQMLSPRQIWTELTFEDLSKDNILRKDFFQFITNESKHKSFDLIIGNPPFNPSPKEDNSKYKNSEYLEEIVNKYKIKHYPIGDSNLALLFLQVSTNLLAKNGLLCLIQPVIPLLHNKDNERFREKLFKEHNVPQIVDFTTLRRVLFPTATVPVCAIFIQNSDILNESITHIVIRRTNPSKERIFFEIDTYDIHSVEHQNASNSFSWKSNLFGGYKLFNLIQKIKSKSTQKIQNLISDSKTNNFSFFKGYIPSSSVLIETKLTHGEFPKYGFSQTKANARVVNLITNNSRELREYLNQFSDILTAYIAGTSTRQGLDRPYDLLVSDILNLPIVSDEWLSISDRILANDIKKYKVSEFGQAEKAITNKEISIVGKSIPNSLIDFSNTYLEALNSIYSNNQKRFVLKQMYSNPACFIIGYKFSETTFEVTNIQEFSQNINSLIQLNFQTLSVKRISFIYNNDEILIIKPKQLRYWLKSVALQDADTTIGDIINFNLQG